MYLFRNINNYKDLNKKTNINNKYNVDYLYLKQNEYLDNFMKNLNINDIYINIIKLKNASHIFPIVYVLK